MSWRPPFYNIRRNFPISQASPRRVIAAAVAILIGFVPAEGADTYSAWKARVFSDAEQADPNISGENAPSPAGDGIPNLLKYAFGLDPHENGSFALPQIGLVEGVNPSTGSVSRYPTITYQTSASYPPSDLYFVPELSFDLQTWIRGDSVFATPMSQEGANPGDPILVTYMGLAPITETSKAFLRLRVLEGQALPADWQIANFGRIGVDPTDDADLDGRTNFDEFLHGTDPNDFYEGRIPALTIVSGDRQWGFPSQFLPFPLVVRATYNGAPLANAPVQISVSQGEARVSVSPNLVPENRIDVRTDENGIATVYAYLGSTPGVASVIQASANGQARSFVETSLATRSGKVAAGEYYSLELDADGSVWTWGNNSYGQLGDGTYNSRSEPLQNSSLGAVMCISGGSKHSAAVESDGSVWTWGPNWNGQLGDGTTDDHPLPNQVPSFTGAIAVSVGQYHTIALRADGTVWSWGYNGDGELGDGTTADSLSPVQVLTESGAPLQDVIAIAAGYYHNLALKADGSVWVWGANWVGALGDGTNEDRHYAVQLAGVNNVKAIAAGAYHSLAVQNASPAAIKSGVSAPANLSSQGSSGALWSWGANFSGQLGDGTFDDRNTPGIVPSVDDIVEIRGGYAHNLVLKSDGTVWSWGDDSWGQVGHDPDSDAIIPGLVVGLTNILSVAAGGSHSLALSSNGLTYAWGSNSDGQLGINEEIWQSAPTPTTKSRDHSGMPDVWQMQWFGHLGVDPNGDEDGDGLTNLKEYNLHTFPNTAYSDGDDIPDGQDGWPLDGDITLPRSPVYQYAVIALGSFKPTALNNDGVVVGNGNNGTVLRWKNGTLTPLPTVQATGFYASSTFALATGVNDAGIICGMELYSNPGLNIDFQDYNTLNFHACIWVPGGETPIDLGDLTRDDGINEEAPIPTRPGADEHGYATPDGTNLGSSQAFGINAAGVIAGDSHTYIDVHKYAPWVMAVEGFDRHACVWREGAGTDLGMLAAAGHIRMAPTGEFFRSVGFAINNDDVVVGESHTDLVYNGGSPVMHAFKRDSSGMVDLGTLGGTNSSARAISNSGHVVGYSDLAEPPHAFGAFVASPGKPMRPLTESAFGYAAGVNSMGQVVGSAGFGSGGALIWQNGQAVALQSRVSPPTQLNAATAIAENGSIACVGPSQGPSGSTAFLLVPAELVPDYNRDGKIDDKDRGKVTPDNPYRFWINDDNDRSEVDGDDIPGRDGSTDADFVTVSASDGTSRGVVDDTRDLVDFFPVYLDIGNLLALFPPDQNFTYTFKQDDEALNFTYTTMDPISSGDFLRKIGAPDQSDNARGLAHAIVQQITRTGVPIDSGLLSSTSNFKRVILLEGRAATRNPLVLEVSDDEHKLMARIELPLSIDGVEKMYRHVNMMAADRAFGGRPTQLDQPENYPDELCNDKTFVFVHGFYVGAEEARGWNAEMFKRMYWSGSKAKFVATTWHADETNHTVVPDYHKNVDNAFATASSFAARLRHLGHNVTVAAHSLGNVVVGSAIQDWGATPANYFMIDAAVPMEAYDGGTPTDDAMIHPDWIPYRTEAGADHPVADRAFASEWYRDPAFATGDAHKTLTWRDRLSNVGTNTYNFYSSSEDVLRRHEGNPGFHDLVEIALTGGRYSWALQEKLKGRQVSVDVGHVGSTYGGWQFSENIGSPPHTPSPSEAVGLDDSFLTSNPAFDPGFKFSIYTPSPGYPEGRTSTTIHADAPDWIIDLTDALRGSPTAQAHRNQLLAEMFPARTLPAGANSVVKFMPPAKPDRNFDMPELFANGWPNERPSTEWKHSDIKAVAYTFIYPLFKDFVNRAREAP
jgi:probable HAF family extracellular repeat protein